MRSLLVIFVVLIVGIFFIVIWDQSSKPIIEQTSYDKISWRIPSDTEAKKVEALFDIRGMNVCPVFFVKKIEEEQYFIACDAGDGSWNYYTAFISRNKVIRTPGGIASSFNPPEIMEEHPANDNIDQDSKVPSKTRSAREAISR